MSATPSAVPSRSPSGSTTDYPYGPLADCGYGNPAFYHQYFDDFDNSLGSTGLYTVGSAGGGTVAHAAGLGGLALFTTGATATNFESIQLPAASFQLPNTTNGIVGKKLFYFARLQMSDITASAVIAGLVNTTATPFTGGSITDGVYFSKTSGAATLSLVTASAGTLTTWPLPASAYALANATQIDLAFYLDRMQNLNIFVGSQLFGWLPQSGTGPVNAATGVSALPVIGRVYRITGPQNGLDPASPVGAPWTVSTANLNLTMGITTTAAAAKTLTADFHGVSQER